MPVVHVGACPWHAVSISAWFVTFIAADGDVRAQALHPFAAPRSFASLSLQPNAAVADCNRDGSPDVLVPGLLGGTLMNALDEDGNPIAICGQGPCAGLLPGLPTLPVVIAMAGGQLDRDHRDDLVTVTNCGTVHVHRNLGSSRIDRCNFAPDAVIDQLLAAYPVTPPLVNYSFPVVRILDFDGNGDNDVLLAGGPIDYWNASTRPGFVCLYRNDGHGTFTPLRFPLSGCVIDCEPADLDLDGTLDHLVVLQETGSLGAFGYDVLHLAIGGAALLSTNPTQYLGIGRYTDLALADIDADGDLDYLVSRTAPGTGSTWVDVTWYAGDGAGTVSTTTWGMLTLPPNPTSLGEVVPAIATGDWNRDGQVDLAVLRGFVLPTATPGQAGSYAPAELLVAMGPNLPFAPFQSIALPGSVRFSATDTPNFAILPLQPAPGFLRTIDLRGDGSADLLVPALRSASGSSTLLTTIANTTPAGPTDCGLTRFGAPSGGVAAHPARLGFDGGAPRLGNPNFAATIANVQGGCLVGLVWGTIGFPNLFTTHGIQVHMSPAEFGYACLASGTAPGEGFAAYPLPIPSNPVLLGDAGCFQYAYWDHVAGTFGGTQATGVRIGL